MIRKIYIILILVSILFSFVSIVNATDIDMDIENNTLAEATSQTQSSTPLSPLSSLPEASLGLGNIINILLITVGVILIFLAIAILIKLK